MEELLNPSAPKVVNYPLMHRALRDLCAVPEPTAAAWQAVGDDAQFELRRPLCRAIPSGIYRVEIEIAELDGHLTAPLLYPPRRGHYSEQSRIELPRPDSNGRIIATVRLYARARHLRFDPTCSPCAFSLGRIRLVRLGDLESIGMRLAWQQFRVHAREHGLHDALRHAFKVICSEGLLRRAPRDLGNDPVGAVQQEYRAWLETFDRLAEDSVSISVRLDKLPRKPVFSILLPVFNTPPELLRRCIASVLAQSYSDWELCVADDASTCSDVLALLDEFAQTDRRIRVVRRERNGHIALASMSALGLARGEFVALLDHDDELAPHALLVMAEAIVKQSDVALLYSDEDKLDSHGERCDPYFKPDWNPDLLRSQNYVNHLLVVRTTLVHEVGGFRSGFEGAQDYDLVLRCVETIDARQIVHVPQVLYHWRATVGSTALAGGEKSYAAEAGLRALQGHLERSKVAGHAEMATAGHYRVRYQLPSDAPSVCLIIPTRDRVDLLSRCVDSLLKRTRYDNFEILIIDNGSRELSTHEYFDRLNCESRVRVLRHDIAFDYSALNNFGVANTTAEFVGLLNNDLEVIQPEWLEELVVQALQPGVGAVGAMLYYPDDRIQHAGVIVGFGGVAGHAYKGCSRGYAGQMNRARLVQSMDAVTAACLLVRRENYLSVGGLDGALKVAFNDVDFCLRLGAAGYRIVWTPFAQLYHWESASRGYEDSPLKQARFADEVGFMQWRWGTRLQCDPAYNPNLSLRGEAFTLAWPPRGSSREGSSEVSRSMS